MDKEDVIGLMFILGLFLSGFVAGKYVESKQINDAYLDLLTQAERAAVYLEQTDSVILNTLPPSETVVYCTEQ